MKGAELIVVRDGEELANRAAALVSARAAAAIAERGRFTLALAGGSTPQATYRRLAASEPAASVDWSRTFLFFGDERWVAPDDDRSNYKMVREALLIPASIAADHVFPVPTSLATAQACARMYARILGEFFVVGDGAMSVFDLVLLGMGEDGHTASLFPGARALAVRKAAVTSSPPGRLPPPVDRITLTYPAINAAREVMFLVSGGNKAEALAEVWRGRAPRRRRPAAGVRPKEGKLTWLVDEAAAAAIHTRRTAQRRQPS